jgi:hypothetical protein
MNEAEGKYRKWKEYLKSGKERIVLLKVDENIEIYFEPGYAKYYMGDMEDKKYNPIFPDACRVRKKNGRIVSDGIVDKKRLFNKYNIKLISWDDTDPIVNSFK